MSIDTWGWPAQHLSCHNVLTQAIVPDADFLVIARLVRTAKDPTNAAERVVDEIAEALGRNR
jgi:hypothetical protein